MVDLSSKIVRDNKIKDYIDFLDRCRRCTKERRIDVHITASAKITAEYMELKEEEYNELTKQFENENDIFINVDGETVRINKDTGEVIE